MKKFACLRSRPIPKRLQLALIVLLGTGCAPQAPIPFEMSTEQLQANGITSYPATALEPSQNNQSLGDETCDNSEITQQVTVYSFNLDAAVPQQLNFYQSSLSCERFAYSLAAKLYIFDEHNAIVASGITDEDQHSLINFTPMKAGTYYLAIVPQYQTEIGGYSFRLASAEATP